MGETTTIFRRVRGRIVPIKVSDKDPMMKKARKEIRKGSLATAGAFASYGAAMATLPVESGFKQASLGLFNAGLRAGKGAIDLHKAGKIADSRVAAQATKMILQGSHKAAKIAKFMPNARIGFLLGAIGAGIYSVKKVMNAEKYTDKAKSLGRVKK